MNFSLLPHTKEQIYGLNTKTSQLLGWELIKFNVPNIWNVSTGKNVKVGIIDTGCDINHDDLKQNIVDGYNFIANNHYPEDDNSHGTHVAGTIAAINNGVGMVGIAPDAKICPIKVLDSHGNGPMTTVSKGIIWGVDNGCDILTMSLGSPTLSKAVESAINYAEQHGVIVFCAAGNSGIKNPIMYPAKHKNTIAIGSVNKNLQRSKFTCTGEELDFLSPGEDILSCTPNNSYSIMSGTSMATPFAVGCAALLLSRYKELGKTKKLHNYQSYIDAFKGKTLPLNENIEFSKANCGYGIIQPFI